jgi:hypothetical protein
MEFRDSGLHFAGQQQQIGGLLALSSYSSFAHMSPNHIGGSCAYLGVLDVKVGSVSVGVCACGLHICMMGCVRGHAKFCTVMIHGLGPCSYTGLLGNAKWWAKDVPDYFAEAGSRVLHEVPGGKLALSYQ